MADGLEPILCTLKSHPEKGVLSFPDPAEALAPASLHMAEGLQQGFPDGSNAFRTC